MALILAGTPEAAGIKAVYVDGWYVSRVVSADREMGYVVRYAVDQHGELIPDEHGDLTTEEVVGNVEFEYHEQT